ncbi:hypothetical protein J4211_01985 [Candidatus Woesearchaeota archaeon]|nr:hypothetical protein [Candidatus Woesearchaeota archaeon]
MKQAKPLEQIEALFEQAQLHKNYAQRYIKLARTIASRSRMHIPTRLRGSYCKKCNSLLGRTRIRNRMIVKVCNVCGTVRRKKMVTHTKIA